MAGREHGRTTRMIRLLSDRIKSSSCSRDRQKTGSCLARSQRRRRGGDGVGAMRGGDAWGRCVVAMGSGLNESSDTISG